ncbi:hypothetical protein BDR03DRAFT_1010462 [Suillus americanus]|nr:hypothetical protein BDR03DRAFT_1010462 [Suillus americanus]
MMEKDGRDSLQANHLPTSKVLKVPQKLSVSVLGEPADETIIEDPDSPAGSNKPSAKLTKAQKVHKNVEAAKERDMEQQKGRAENEEDIVVVDSNVDDVRDPPSNKAAQATSTATSTGPTPNEPPLCPSSHPPLHPPSCPPSRPPLDDEHMHNGEEQDDSTHPESESPRPYMWKFKVVSHTITHPTPKHQGSATNSMQPVQSKTGSGKSNAEDKTHSKDCGYSSNNDLPSGSHRNFDALIVPMWIDFISTLNNMDLALPNIKHTVSKSKDPVYKILMQHAYNYCSDFRECAKIVIAKYIEEQGWMLDKIQQVVAYIVPEQIPWVNEKGQKVFVNPLIYPYMWKECRGDEKDPDTNQCILNTFALYLEQVHCLPTRYCCKQMLKGALSIATVAVEQMWKITELIMESIDRATHHKWKKIFKGAAPFIDAHQK